MTVLPARSQTGYCKTRTVAFNHDGLAAFSIFSFMRVYACVCACVRVCPHTPICLCVCVCVHVRMHLCVLTRMCDAGMEPRTWHILDEGCVPELCAQPEPSLHAQSPVFPRVGSDCPRATRVLSEKKEAGGTGTLLLTCQ